MEKQCPNCGKSNLKKIVPKNSDGVITYYKCLKCGHHWDEWGD
jgi:transposase-like protein